MAGDKSSGPREKTRTRELLEDFYELSRKILKYANKGVNLAEFQHEISTITAEYSACDAVEFRVRDADQNYLSELTQRPKANFRFGFIETG